MSDRARVIVDEVPAPGDGGPAASAFPPEGGDEASPVDDRGADVADHADARGGLHGWSAAAFAIWIALVVLGLAVVLFARVTIYPAEARPRRWRIIDVWALFRDDLPDVSRPELLTALFYGASVLFVAGTLAALLIALNARDGHPAADQDPV